MGGDTDPHIIRNGTLMIQRYIDELLKFLIVPYVQQVSISFLLVRVRCDTTRCVKNILKTEQYNVWPQCYFDLNPIKFICNTLG